MEPTNPTPPRHLLVPLDGSRLAEAALPAALATAERLAARLTLLHVLERRAPETVHGDPHLTGVDAAERYLAALVTRCAAAGVAVDTHVHPNPEGDVVASIAAHAAELGADLIVLCAHGHGGARHRLTGALAQQVIRRATPPVLLVRPAAAEAGFAPGTVVVALDGTPAAEAVLPVALAMARGFAAGVVLAIGIPTLGTVDAERAVTARFRPTATAAALDLEEASAAAYLDRLAARLRDTGLPVRAEVGRGDAVQTVGRLAAVSEPSLLALATHGRAGLDALWTASVGSRLVEQARGPLLLVHPGQPPGS